MIKVVKTDFVTPVWISLVRYGFQKVEYIFVHHLSGLMTTFVIQNLYRCVGHQKLHVIMYVVLIHKEKAFIGERKPTDRSIIEIRN